MCDGIRTGLEVGFSEELFALKDIFLRIRHKTNSNVHRKASVEYY